MGPSKVQPKHTKARAERATGGLGSCPPRKEGKEGASLKAVEAKKRTVFKPILDNPYTRSPWPPVSVTEGSVIVELLCALLNPLSTYEEYVKSKVTPLPEVPEIASYVTVGFNSTNAAVENQTQQRLFLDTNDENYVVAVIVCRSDITSALVTSHFPLLCAAASLKGKPVRLIQVPKGSKAKLSQAVGKSDGSVIGLRKGAPGAQALLQMIEKVPIPVVEWLNGDLHFAPPLIKKLKTTAPIKNK
jgi:ribonuclease P/MRP protein subunit POP3